jgi:CMP-N-acetylneuraminic acid synthetase
LRTVEDVEGAWELFESAECDAVVSGHKSNKYPGFNMVRLGEYVKDADNNLTSRQQCQQWYDLDSTVWIYSDDAVMRGERIPAKTKLYEVDERRAASIDNEADWQMAEYLMRKERV